MQNVQSNIWQGNFLMFGNNYLNVVQTPQVVGASETNSNISQTTNSVDAISSTNSSASNNISSNDANIRSFNKKITSKAVASKISTAKKISSSKKKTVTPVNLPLQINKTSANKITTTLPSIVTPRQNDVKENQNSPNNSTSNSTSLSQNNRCSAKIMSPPRDLLTTPKNTLPRKTDVEKASPTGGKVLLKSINTSSIKKSTLNVKQNRSSLLLKAHTSRTRSTSLHCHYTNKTKKTPSRRSTTNRLNETTISKTLPQSKKNFKHLNKAPKTSSTSSSPKTGTPQAYYTPKERILKEIALQVSEKRSKRNTSMIASNSKNEKSLKVKKVVSSAVKKPPLVTTRSTRSSLLSINSSSTQSSYRSLRSESTPSPVVKSANTSRESRLLSEISQNVIPETPFEQTSLNITNEKFIATSSSQRNSNATSEATIVNQGQVTPVNRSKLKVVMRSSKRESLRRRIFDNSVIKNCEDSNNSLLEKKNITSSRTSFTTVQSSEKEMKLQQKSPFNSSKLSQNSSLQRTPPNRGSVVVVMRSSKRDSLKKQFFNRTIEGDCVKQDETPIKPRISFNSSPKVAKLLRKSSDIKNRTTSILELRSNKAKPVLQKSKSLSYISEAEQSNTQKQGVLLNTSRASRSINRDLKVNQTQSPQFNPSKKSVEKLNKEVQSVDKGNSASTFNEVKAIKIYSIRQKELTKSLDVQPAKHCGRGRKCKSVTENIRRTNSSENVGVFQSSSTEKSANSKITENDSILELTPNSVSTRSESLSLSRSIQLSNNSSFSLLDSLEITTPESSEKISVLESSIRTPIQTRTRLLSGNTSLSKKTLERILSTGKNSINLKIQGNINHSTRSSMIDSKLNPSLTIELKTLRRSSKRSGKDSSETDGTKKNTRHTSNSGSALDITGDKIITSTPRNGGRTPAKPEWNLLSETVNSSIASSLSLSEDLPKRSNIATEVDCTKKKATTPNTIDIHQSLKKLKGDDELSSATAAPTPIKDGNTPGVSGKKQKIPLKRSKSLSSISSEKSVNKRSKRNASLISLTPSSRSTRRSKSESVLSDKDNLNSTKKSLQTSKTKKLAETRQKKMSTPKRSSNKQTTPKIHSSQKGIKQKETKNKKRKVEIYSSLVDKLKGKNVSKESRSATCEKSSTKKPVRKTSTSIKITKKQLIFNEESPKSPVRKNSRQPYKNTAKVTEKSRVKNGKEKLYKSLTEIGESKKKDQGKKRKSLPVILSSSKKTSPIKKPKQIKSPKKVLPAKGNVTPQNTTFPSIIMRSSKRSALKRFTPSPGSTPKTAIVIRRKAITEQKPIKVTTTLMKRKLEALCLEKSKAAAKKLKSEPPKSLGIFIIFTPKLLRYF